MASQRFFMDSFDGFVLLGSKDKELSEADAADFLKEIRDSVDSGASLIFIDLGHADKIPATAFAGGLEKIKGQGNVEFVFVGSPALSKELKSTPLADVVQLYEQRDQGVRKVATKNILSKNFFGVRGLIHKYMEGAIDAGVRRWIGQPPQKINSAAAEVNPTSDVVSVVTMHIDGGEFHLYLASGLSTMRSMASQILNTPLLESDPAVNDGACELLNYLTAYFRQQLTEQDSVVDATAPQILPPDEVMELLNRTPKVRRVHTAHGHFDIWIEAAA